MAAVTKPASAAFLLLSFLSCAGHAPPLAATGAPQLCELDLDCAAGNYCSAGVCDFDCQGASDCGANQGCDARGRCLAASAQPEPPPYAGHLVLPPRQLALSPAEPTATFTLSNDGQAAIGRFHVLSDTPGIAVSLEKGTLAPGESVQVTVTADPAFSGSGATVHVLSTGGSGDVTVAYGSAMSGRLEGEVHVAAPFELGQAPFAIEVAGGSTLAGSVDGSASLLWPVNAAVSGSDDGEHFTALFSFVAETGQAGDPLFDVPVRRSIVLAGNHTSAGAVAGSYREVIEGLPKGSAVSSGTFALRLVGPATGVVAAAFPAFAAQPAAALPAACSGQTADAFFQAGFPFEQWSAASSYEGGQCLLASGETGPCVVPSAASCALGGFRDDSIGALDVWRAQATYALLSGKDAIAQVLQPIGTAFGGQAIDQEIAALQGAVQSLQAGLHGAPGGGGLLAAANLNAVWALALGQPSTRDVAQLDDVQRFGGVVAAGLFAAGQAADRMQRAGAAGPLTLGFAQQVAGGALLDLAALGLLLPKPEAVSGLPDAFASLALSFSRVAHGLNAVGYQADYVPFSYDPANPADDLFQTLSALTQKYLVQAQADEQKLASDQRDFDHDTEALRGALVDVSQKANDEITQLCGASGNPNVDGGCGGQDGQIAQDQAGMAAAQAAMEAAQQRLSAATQKVARLQQQLQTETQQQDAELTAVEADGEQIVLTDRHQAQEQLAGNVVGCVGNVIGAILSLGLTVGSAAQSCEAMGDELVLNSVSDTIKADRARNDTQVQLLIGQQEVTDAALQDSIVDADADAEAGAMDVLQQTQLFAAAAARVGGDWAQLQQALDDRAQSEAEAAQASADDPSFRLYADADALQWAQDLALARKWCFLSERALEYTINASFPEAQRVFEDETATNLAAALAAMQDAHDTDVLQNGWDQDREDLISLRRDVLGIHGPKTDPVTGQLLTEGEQFQQLVALPAHRDPAGNLLLQFSTSIEPGNGLFSTDVGADRLVGIKMNLVGSQLGGLTGYVTLTQSGDSQLRSSDGTLVGYQLEPKTALVPAGINLASLDDPTVPESTDLFARPVDDAAWTLLFDQVGDPRDAQISLGDLEDIQLWVHHRGRTLQNQQ